ncbi:MAG: complex I NDUFA9 subunit family protein [Pseudomonadota bacterium]|nr:complex I NDUFA9 subunit family protein [Pseudomonadota bacterium]
MDIVTVFGGSGFIGRYVIRELAKTGARIRAAVRRPELAGFLKPMGDVGQIVPIATNVRYASSVAKAVSGADTVINLVGVLYPSGKQSFQNLQAKGAKIVAREAAEAGTKSLVHISALGAAQNSPSLYASTKAQGEEFVLDEFPDATIIRPSLAFGPEDDFFNRFAALARISPFMPLIGGGYSKFQPIYVGDLASAVTTVAENSRTRSNIYEIGGPKTYSFRELIEIILQQIGRRRLLAPIPFQIAMLQAFFMEFLPVSILTRDQVSLLRHDNILSGKQLGLLDLGIEPTALETILPTYLNRYRRGVWHN